MSAVSVPVALVRWSDVLSMTTALLGPIAGRLTRLPLAVLQMKLLPPGVEATAFAVDARDRDSNPRPLPKS